MICCDSWGHCTRGPGCAAHPVASQARVAPVKTHYRRHNDLDGYLSRPAPLEVPVADDAQDLDEQLRALVNRASAPGQRGSVWFAGTEPTDHPIDQPADQPPKREPLTAVELFAVLVLIVLSVASTGAVLSGLWWLVSLEGAFA